MLWKVQKTKGIVHASKLYSQLDALGKTMGGLVQRTPLSDRRRKVEYNLRWDRLLGTSQRWSYEVEACANWIRTLSRKEIECIASLAKISKFDLLTVFLYLDILLGELELYLSPWIEKRLRNKSLGDNAPARILAASLLDFSKAQDVFHDQIEARHMVEAVRDLLRRRTDQFVFDQRGLAFFKHRGLYQMERDVLKTNERFTSDAEESAPSTYAPQRHAQEDFEEKKTSRFAKGP